MNNGDQLKKANETHLHHTSLMLACQDLESATYAARKAREDLRRATRNRLTAKERHDDALTVAHRKDGEQSESVERAWLRVNLVRWAMQDAGRNEADALEDYRDALKRVEVLGAAAGEADSHEVPAYLRHRARKAIALADAFGNKVAMDATLHDGLERPVLPELEPEVEVTEFAVIDPLEPLESFTAPEPRAKLVPLEDYVEGTPWTAEDEASYQAEAADRAAGLVVNVHRAEILAHLENDERSSAIDPDDDGAEVPAGERLETEAERFAYWCKVNGVRDDEGDEALEAFRRRDCQDREDELEDPAAGGWKPEHMSPEWWKQVTLSAPLNVKDPLPATDEDENLAPVCPECRNGKHGNCDGTAWDDHEDALSSCSCLTCEAKVRENGEAGR